MKGVHFYVENNALNDVMLEKILDTIFLQSFCHGFKN